MLKTNPVDKEVNNIIITVCPRQEDYYLLIDCKQDMQCQIG